MSKCSSVLHLSAAVSYCWKGYLCPFPHPFCWPVQLRCMPCPESHNALENQLSNRQLIPKPDTRGTARWTAAQWNRAILLSQPAITPAHEAGLSRETVFFGLSAGINLSVQFISFTPFQHFSLSKTGSKRSNPGHSHTSCFLLAL